MATSMKNTIATALLAKLDTIAALKYKAFDRVRMLTSDFADHELPAVQLIDLVETVEHERHRARKAWTVVLQLVMKQTDASGTVDQKALWDLMYDIERKIWENPNLGIPGVLHPVYLENSTDLHSVEGFYLGFLVFEVNYYQPLVDDC